MNNSDRWYSDFGEYSIDEWVRERILNNPDELYRFQKIIDLIPEDAKTILDIGCGPGVFLHLLKKNRNIKELGIEISDNKIAYANNVLQVKVQKGDAAELPFPDKAFDVVTALEVLEHLPCGTYERALTEMARVANTTIIISVPYNETRFFMTCPYCGTKFNPSYHLRSFNEIKLNDIFHGFKLAQVIKAGKTLVPKSPLSTLITKILLRNYEATEFVCPACGFKKSPKKTKTNRYQPMKRSLHIYSFIKYMIKFMLFSHKPRWMIAVYNRN